jgi:hypothetical protein
MSSIFRRSALALTILGFASISYAGTSNWFLNGGTVNGAFGGVEGLYLQPRNGDLSFVTLFPNTVTDVVNVIGIRPNYHWGWRVFAGLNFCGNDDLVASWAQFHTSSRNNLGTPRGLITGVPAESLPRWTFISDWSDISSKVTFDLDDAYAALGHTIVLNNAWSFRYATGVEYARVDSDLTVQATEFDSDFLTPLGFKSDSHFKGTGPRLEADMVYNIPFGFSLFATGNAALLIGTRQVALNTFNSADGELHSVAFNNKLIVVPKVGMRLGVGYSYVFGAIGGEGASCTNTTLTIDAGWQLETYIHAIERPITGDAGSVDFKEKATAPKTASIGITNFGSKVSNFGDQGLFLGVRINTNWA